MKVAVVADWLTNRGGAEHVVEAMAEAFPQATVYTSVFAPEHFPALKNRVETTCLQGLPRAMRRKHQWLLPFLPFAFRGLDLSEYDVVISSSSAFAKCVRITQNQRHVCYCHTPTRYLYHAQEDYKKQYRVPVWMRPLKAILWGPLMRYLTWEDQRGARGVTQWLANSAYVAQRIQKYYSAEANVLYPCIDPAPFLATKRDPQGYFLAVGRFIPYKRFDLLIRTFAANGLPLKLAGIGPELEPLRTLATSLGATNITFLGFVKREELPKLYAGAEAFLFPAEEDFGLTPVEAMSAGTPVLYYAKGGATESVAEGCGIGFDAQTVASLQAAIDTYNAQKESFHEDIIRARGAEFSTEIYIKKLREIVEQ